VVGRQHDDELCFARREQVRRVIDEAIATLLLERERDPDRALLPRVLGRRARRRP
jgi:hypothetical protein